MTYRARQRVALSVVAAVAVTALTAASANASGGGSSIAGAPQLPIGTHLVSGANAKDRGEFWRLQLSAGDRLTIDYGSTNGCSVSIYVFLPSVTDNTIRNANPVVSDSTSSKGEIVWTATGSGSWIVQISGCSPPRLGYELTASVKRGTATAASGGDSIASAPQLRIGAHVVSGANAGERGEFWRIRLFAGDRLTIDYGSTNGCSVYIYILSPRVTDYTIRNANPIASDSTSSKSRLGWTATRASRWILEIGGCSQPRLGYQMTAHVRHRKR